MFGAEPTIASRAKLFGVAGFATLCFGYSVAALWYADLRFSLPTPRPDGLVEPPRGTSLPVDRWLAPLGSSADARPVLLHFFNPTCACTRFNVRHVKTLVAAFGDRVRFVAVAQTDLDDRDLAIAMEALALDVPYVVDREGRIAKEAGVYSTPQAVLVNARRELVYRGNYNASRYCADRETEYARIALESLVGSGTAIAHLPETPAYGCELPTNLADEDR